MDDAVVTVSVAEREYAFCFNARARYTFQKLAGYRADEARIWGVWTSAPGQITPEHFSDVETPQLLTALLEGGRARTGDRSQPWTIDEVLDDVLDGLKLPEQFTLLAACTRAIAAASAGLPETPAGDDSGKAQTTG